MKQQNPWRIDNLLALSLHAKGVKQLESLHLASKVHGTCMWSNHKNSQCIVAQCVALPRVPGQLAHDMHSLHKLRSLVAHSRCTVTSQSFYRSYRSTCTLFILKRTHYCFFCSPRALQGVWKAAVVSHNF